MTTNPAYTELRTQMDEAEDRLRSAGFVYSMVQQNADGRTWIVWDWKRNRRVTPKGKRYNSAMEAAEAAING